MLPDAHVLLDPRGVIVAVNTAAEGLMRTPRRYLEGQSLRRLLGSDAGTDAFWSALVGATRALAEADADGAGRTWIPVVSLLCGDGEEIDCDVAMAVMDSSDSAGLTVLRFRVPSGPAPGRIDRAQRDTVRQLLGLGNDAEGLLQGVMGVLGCLQDVAQTQEVMRWTRTGQDAAFAVRGIIERMKEMTLDLDRRLLGDDHGAPVLAADPAGDKADQQTGGGPRDDLPVIDIAMVRLLAADTGVAVLPALTEGFAADVMTMVDGISAAMRQGDLSVLRHHGHNLAGCAPTFGAMRLHALACAVEARSREGALSEALWLAEAIPQEAEAALTALDVAVAAILPEPSPEKELPSATITSAG